MTNSKACKAGSWEAKNILAVSQNSWVRLYIAKGNMGKSVVVRINKSYIYFCSAKRHCLHVHYTHETSPTKSWGEEKETHWLAGWAAVKVRSSFQKPSPSATFSEPTNRSSRGFSFILAKLVDTVTPMAPSETRRGQHREKSSNSTGDHGSDYVITKLFCACAWKASANSTSSVFQCLLVRM